MGAQALARPQATDARIARAWKVLAGVPDPEVPAVSVCDLGIVRDVRLAGEALEVVLTPTYSGCPATEVIEADVLAAIAAAGLGPARVTLQRAPAWTTDWITPAARDKLRAYGIAPPHATHAAQCGGGAQNARAQVLQFLPGAARATPAVACPQCGSTHTVESSRFGSTACKALYKCLDCQEPFDFFKPY